MKKISLLLSFVLSSVFVFAQTGSVLIQPSNDEVMATKYGGSEPNLAGRYALGTSSAPLAVSSGSALVSFGARGYTGTAFTSDRARITMSADQTFTSGANGTRISFFTTTNGTAAMSERMRIDNTGFVGIGTVNPARNLHVFNGSSGVTPTSFAPLFIENSTNSYLQLGSPEASFTGVLFGKPSNAFSGGILYDGSSNLQLRTGGSNVRMIVTSAGNVGIGATTPTAKLDIDGDVVVRRVTVSTTGTLNSLSRSGASSIYFDGIGAVTLNGITGGQDGMILYIFTASGTNLTIGNDSGSAAAANRIATHTGANFLISGRGGATLIYNSDTTSWRVVSVAQ
jgi:hypothetical protein